jgi:hypothetical protein
MPGFVRRSILAIALAALSAGASGCIWLAIPSLAYQGYKYEHPDKTASKSSASKKKSASSTSQTPPQYQIE